MNKHLTFLSALALTTGLSLQAQNVNQMVIQANKIGAEIQPTMYGHFFEDINYGADGGLYAELIKNRSFEFPQSFMGWDIFGNVTLQNDGRLNATHIMYAWQTPDMHTNAQVLKTKDFSVSDSKPMKNIVLPYGQEEKTRKYE